MMTQSVFTGKDAKNNKLLLKILALNGPLHKFEIRKRIQNGQVKIPYPTVSRRIDDLLRKKYLKMIKQRSPYRNLRVKAYSLSLRGTLVAILIPEVTSRENLLQFLKNASMVNPFCDLSRALLENGSDFDFVSDVFVSSMRETISSGLLNLDVVDQENIIWVINFSISNRLGEMKDKLMQNPQPLEKVVDSIRSEEAKSILNDIGKHQFLRDADHILGPIIISALKSIELQGFSLDETPEEKRADLFAELYARLSPIYWILELLERQPPPERKFKPISIPDGKNKNKKS